MATKQLSPSSISRMVHICTTAEAMIIILENLNEENIQEVLSACPADLQISLRNWISELPADSNDEGWSKPLYVRALCYDRALTERDIEKLKEDALKRFRNGVRVYRSKANRA